MSNSAGRPCSVTVYSATRSTSQAVTRPVATAALLAGGTAHERHATGVPLPPVRRPRTSACR